MQGKAGYPKQPKDRKLGEEWEGWSGDLVNYEWNIQEGRRTFLLFSSIGFLIFVVGALSVWYMIDPRLRLISPVLSKGFAILLVLSLAGLVSLFGLMIVAAVTERRFLPVRMKVERFIGFMMPKVVWLGGKFGISKDRMFNSFVKVNNSLMKAIGRKGTTGERLLILLPRCLSKSIRQQVEQLGEMYHCRVSVVSGGNAARKLILDAKPTAVIGVACERDLAAGIQDVAPRVPVIGIPNIRPEGPCKNSTVNLEEIERAIRFLLDANEL